MHDYISRYGYNVSFVSNSVPINESGCQNLNTHFLLTRALYTTPFDENLVDSLFIEELVYIEKHWLSNLSITFQDDLVQRVKEVYTLWCNIFISCPPKLFLIWGSTSPLSKLHVHLCNRFDVDYLIIERGHFSRSLLVDQIAQFSRSARLSIPQPSLELTTSNLEEFSKIRKYVLGLDELPYADKNYSNKNITNSEKLIILMIGVNDLGCGISYGSNKFKERHSSYYYSTQQAFIDVVKALDCMQENIMLYFKPHPADRFDYSVYASERVEMMESFNINQLIEQADVCVTLSTTAIAKVILESKPLVTMSLTDISSQNIAYEACHPSDLVFQLRQAINKIDFERRDVAGKKFLVELIKRNTIFLDSFASFTRTAHQLGQFITKKLSESERSLTSQEIENGIDVPACGYQLFNYKILEQDKKSCVDVVVPIYNDALVTNACVQAAKKAVEKYEKARLILINDCSPYSDINSLLDSYKAERSNSFIILDNSKNLGFSGTVNCGLTMSVESDVILLNSDAFVTVDTIVELASAAYAHRSVASVTPMSNNAGLMSNPLKDGQELELEYAIDFVEEKNKIAQKNNLHKAIEVPIGHGFCLYIKRKAIQRVGLFDELSFGKGYSEEIDFCMRARRLGFIHLGLLSTYVGHVGGVSFGHDSNFLRIKNRDIIKSRYPDYFEEIKSFMENDPIDHYRI